MPYHIVYSSQAAKPMTLTDLEEILEDARSGNESRNITGALIYADGVFFQVLEGEKDAVRKLMSSIASDSRHHSVRICYEMEVDEPAFKSWRMAYLAPSAEQLSAWAGLPAAATVDKVMADIHADASRVPRILVNVLDALTH
jgi:hypothetical protein